MKWEVSERAAQMPGKLNLWAIRGDPVISHKMWSEPDHSAQDIVASQEINCE